MPGELTSLGKKVPMEVVVAVPVAVGGEEVLLFYRHSLSSLSAPAEGRAAAISALGVVWL